ncbi:HET-domain-containing protein, partial [Polyplosphaeria fusca]
MAPRIVPPKIDFTPLSKWLDFCDAKHVKECTVSRRVRLPGFKVIDCHTNQIVSQDAVDCRYVALSYVWGEPGASSDGDSMFPATIADSITVCVALGFRYLWVDRYCINQGNAAEKHVQIHLMDRIYMQAELTIFAAAGSGSDDGLPGVSTMIRTPQQRLKIGDMELVEILNSVDRVSMSTWASRAWTYQEGSMSKRRLIFTDQEVVFLCSRMYCQE